MTLSSISIADIILPSRNIIFPSRVEPSGDVSAWLTSFLVTLALELALVAIIWPKLGRPVALRRWVLACLIGNVISHPLATLIWIRADRALHGAGAWGAFIAIECGVIAFEALVFRRAAAVAWNRAMTVALIVNTPTALIGAWLCFCA
jgi:hypothetical protein